MVLLLPGLPPVLLAPILCILLGTVAASPLSRTQTAVLVDDNGRFWLEDFDNDDEKRGGGDVSSFWKRGFNEPGMSQFWKRGLEGGSDGGDDQFWKRGGGFDLAGNSQFWKRSGPATTASFWKRGGIASMRRQDREQPDMASMEKLIRLFRGLLYSRAQLQQQQQQQRHNNIHKFTAQPAAATMMASNNHNSNNKEVISPEMAGGIDLAAAELRPKEETRRRGGQDPAGVMRPEFNPTGW